MRESCAKKIVDGNKKARKETEMNGMNQMERVKNKGMQ